MYHLLRRYASAVSGKNVKRLRRQGIVPANIYGRNQSSMSLQLNSLVLQKLLARGGKDAILALKVGDKPVVQALIKQVQRSLFDPASARRRSPEPLAPAL
ncbi:MAG: hypothetical protein HYX94_00240 [Chloroflexi bacterium]|nr:hypothetical protein [Chloroflexota bacterium]